METRMLLCELHVHTTWSDGALSLTELVDLYGMHGFDVLCVTDHLLRSEERSYRLRPETFPHYVKTIERESRRASEQYDLLLIPGAELTHVAADPDEAGHALALGLRSFCSVDEGLESPLRSAQASGAAIIAAHPHGGNDDPHPDRTTRWFWRNHERLDGVVDRYELVNRRQTFGWVAEAGLPMIVTGDFHRAEHLWSWKTLLPCAKSERAVVGYLRSERRAYLMPWGLSDELGDPVAA
jgi:predicted metal-dependent phosphoesterase TrpH